MDTGERQIGQRLADIEAKHVERYEYARRYCEGKDVLDAACGCGYGSNLLSRGARSVLGFDNSQEAIDYARQFWGATNVSFKQFDLDSDLTSLGNFDVVVSFETIEHLNTPVIETCQKFYEILRPGGLLVLSHPEKEADLNSIGLLARLKIMTVNTVRTIDRLHWKAVSVLWRSVKARVFNKGKSRTSYHKHFNIDGESLKNSLADIGFQTKDEWYQPGRFYYSYHIMVAGKNE